MDHTFVVRGGEAERGLVDDLRGRADGDLVFALEQGAERLAFDKLHDEERLALVFADVVDLDDVRIIQCRHAARFAQEAFLHALVVRQRIRQDLDGDIAVERGLVSLVDHAHAATTQFGNDVVVSQSRFHGVSGAPGASCNTVESNASTANAAGFVQSIASVCGCRARCQCEPAHILSEIRVACRPAGLPGRLSPGCRRFRCAGRCGRCRQAGSAGRPDRPGAGAGVARRPAPRLARADKP